MLSKNYRVVLALLVVALVAGVSAETPAEKIRRLEGERAGLENQVQASTDASKQFNETLNGAKGRYTAFTNMDWNAVFGGDYEGKLLAEWGELHQDREFAPVERNIRNVESKRAAYQANPSEENRVAVLEAEVSYKRAQLVFFQARRLFYEERVDGFMNAMGDIVEGIGGQVAGGIVSQMKMKLAEIILSAEMGDLGAIPIQLAEGVMGIIKGASTGVLKAAIREAFIDSFRRRNANLPRYLGEYWFDNHILPSQPAGWLEKQAESKAKSALQSALKDLDSRAAQDRLRSVAEMITKEELMKDREFLRELRQRWGPGQGAALRSHAYSELNRKTNERLAKDATGFLKDIPVNTLIDISVHVTAVVENAFGNPEVNLTTEANLVRAYKDAIAFLGKYPRLFNRPGDEKAFVLEAVKEAGQFQQLMNAIDKAVAADPTLSQVPGDVSDAARLAKAVAAWEEAHGKVWSEAMAPFKEGIDRRIQDLRPRADSERQAEERERQREAQVAAFPSWMDVFRPPEYNAPKPKLLEPPQFIWGERLWAESREAYDERALPIWRAYASGVQNAWRSFRGSPPNVDDMGKALLEAVRSKNPDLMKPYLAPEADLGAFLNDLPPLPQGWTYDLEFVSAKSEMEKHGPSGESIWIPMWGSASPATVSAIFKSVTANIRWKDASGRVIYSTPNYEFIVTTSIARGRSRWYITGAPNVGPFASDMKFYYTEKPNLSNASYARGGREMSEGMFQVEGRSSDAAPYEILVFGGPFFPGVAVDLQRAGGEWATIPTNGQVVSIGDEFAAKAVIEASQTPKRAPGKIIITVTKDIVRYQDDGTGNDVRTDKMRIRNFAAELSNEIEFKRRILPGAAEITQFDPLVMTAGTVNEMHVLGYNLTPLILTKGARFSHPGITIKEVRRFFKRGDKAGIGMDLNVAANVPNGTHTATFGHMATVRFEVVGGAPPTDETGDESATGEERLTDEERGIRATAGAEASARSLIEAYSARDISAIRNRIAAGYRGATRQGFYSWAMLMKSIEQDARLMREVAINIGSMSTRQTADGLEVVIEWSGSYVHVPTGATVRDNGRRTVFLFQSSREGWKLARQSGDAMIGRSDAVTGGLDAPEIRQAEERLRMEAEARRASSVFVQPVDRAEASTAAWNVDAFVARVQAAVDRIIDAYQRELTSEVTDRVSRDFRGVSSQNGSIDYPTFSLALQSDYQSFDNMQISASSDAFRVFPHLKQAEVVLLWDLRARLNRTGQDFIERGRRTRFVFVDESDVALLLYQDLQNVVNGTILIGRSDPSTGSATITADEGSQTSTGTYDVSSPSSGGSDAGTVSSSAGSTEGSVTGGTLTQNTTITANQTLTSDLIVPSGVTLTVNNATISVSNGAKIEVFGTLNGTSATFRGNGTWAGIVFQSGSTGNLTSMTVSDATDGIRAVGGNITVTGFTGTSNTDAIEVAGGIVSVSNVSITSGTNALRVSGGTLTATGGTISGVTNHEVIASSGSVTLSGSLSITGTGVGAVVDCDAGVLTTTGAVTITGGGGVFLGSGNHNLGSGLSIQSSASRGILLTSGAYLIADRITVNQATSEGILGVAGARFSLTNVNITNCGSVGVEGTAGATPRESDGWYLFSNNGPDATDTSTATPDSGSGQQQYRGMTSVTNPRTSAN